MERELFLLNYIKEMNAFYVRMETAPLSASAIALWHALMHVNNRARWVERFSVAAAVLCLKANLPVSTFKRARSELKEKGLIRHISRGKQAPLYEMVSLVVEAGKGQKGEAFGRPEVKQEKVVAVSKDKEVAKARKGLTMATFNLFIEHFSGEPRRAHRELHDWAELMGDVLVYEAIVRAVENDKNKWRYVRGILKKWYGDGLLTMQAVRASEASYRMKRHGVKPKNEVLPEVLPDWFKGRRGHA